MTLCLVLGGGNTLWRDVESLNAVPDGVVACNQAGTEWPGDLAAWVSLHAGYFKLRGWRQQRHRNGHPRAQRHIGHTRAWDPALADPRGLTSDLEAVEFNFPGQTDSGSSGLFAAKVALVDLGFDRVVFAGVPMTPARHFYGGPAWRDYDRLRAGWLQLHPEWRGRMRSLSGWTKELLGAPDRQFLQRN